MTVTGSVLVDSDILIDLLRGDERALNWIGSVTESGAIIYGSVITRTELIQGKRGGEEGTLSQLFDSIDWIDVTKGIADRAGELSLGWRHSHSGILMGDYLIAASALEAGLRLWTKNVKHYPMLTELRPPY